MANQTTTPLTIRVTAAMQERITALRERMSAAAGGVYVSRHAAAAAALGEGLNSMERKVGEKAKKRRKG